MKALICEAYGGPERLVFGQLPAPALEPDGVRIRVHAAALNFPDLLMIEGKYQYRAPFPFAPGMECAGEVIEVGAQVRAFGPGDRVAAHPWRGCLAEEVVAAENLVYRLPEAMDDATAAGFCLAQGTVYHALVDRGRLQAGETLLVLGATGGVGIHALGLAKALGARVIAAAGSDEKLALAEQFGADHGVNYSTGEIRQRVKELTDGRGADMVFDPVGGALTAQAMRAAGWNGRLLIIGFAAGRIAEIASNHVLIKGQQIIGVAYHRFCSLEPAKARAQMQEMFALFEAGKLKPHHSLSFPLAEGGAALRALAERRATGKIIITMD